MSETSTPVREVRPELTAAQWDMDDTITDKALRYTYEGGPRDLVDRAPCVTQSGYIIGQEYERIQASTT